MKDEANATEVQTEGIIRRNNDDDNDEEDNKKNDNHEQEEEEEEEALVLLRLEQEQQMVMVRRIIHEALIQISGGCPPFLRPKTTTRATTQEEEEVTSSTTTNNNASMTTTTTTTTIMSLPEYRNFVSRLCCQDSTITRTTKDVRDLSNGKPWDYEIRTITSIYNRFHPKNKQQVNNNKMKGRRKKKKSYHKEDQVDGDGGHRGRKYGNNHSLILTSDYGVERSVDNAVKFSTILLPFIEDALPNNKGWDVRVKSGTSGNILLVSPQRSKELRRDGRLPCPSCEVWIKSKRTSTTGELIPNAAEKGLWWHQQQFHATNHATATAFAASVRITSQAILLYEDAQVLKMEELLLSHTNNNNNHLHHQSSTTTKNKKQHDTTSTPASRKAMAFQYAQDGNLIALQSAIHNEWIDPQNDVDHRGASLLLWAAGAGHLSIVQYLIEQCHCNPRQGQQQLRTRGFANRTALHWSCRNGHLAVVQYLITKCGGSIILHDKTADGTTAIGWAAWQGRLDILQWLYSVYPIDVVQGACQVNQFGCNALLWAAQGTADTATLDWLAEITTTTTATGGATGAGGATGVVVAGGVGATAAAAAASSSSSSCASIAMMHVNDNGHGMLHKAGQRNRFSVASWFCKRLIHYLENEADNNSSGGGGGSNNNNMDDLLKLIGPDLEGCTPSDLAGIEGHVDLAKDVVLMERKILQAAILYGGAKWPSSDDKWRVDQTVLKNEWKPGCGLLRLWLAYQEFFKSST